MVGSALEVLMQLVYGLPIEEMPYGTRQGPVLQMGSLYGVASYGRKIRMVWNPEATVVGDRSTDSGVFRNTSGGVCEHGQQECASTRQVGNSA